MIKNIALLFIIICFISLNSYAGGNYELEGWVKFQNKTPASGVVMSIGGYSVVTDRNGYFRIKFLKVGEHVISISPPGKPTRSVRVTIKDNYPYETDNNNNIWKIIVNQRQLLDNNRLSIAITSHGLNLYQMHRDGKIWQYTSPPIKGWRLLDNNRATYAILCHSGYLYQIHRDGKIWQFTGTPIKGWRPLNYDPTTIAFFVTSNMVRKDFIINW